MNFSISCPRSFPLLGIVILFLLLLSSSAFPQILPEDPARGARLFISKECVKCHALKGEGGKAGPDFGRIDLGDTQLELASKLLNHIPAMLTGMERMKMIKPNLTGDEIGNIAAYLYFLKFFDEPGNATHGKYLFTEKGCANCHALSGKGKEGEPGLDQFPQNITPVFLSQMIWNHGSVMIAGMVKLGMKWPTFEGTEMMDLLEYIKMNAKGPREAAFITPGNPMEGRKVFVAKGCIQCHTIRGEGGKGGEDLGKTAKVFYKSLTQIASIMWNKGPSVLAKMAQPKSGIPTFSPKEMADLMAYLYFLHFIDESGNAPRGGKSFSDLGCSKCHGFDGRRGEWMQIDLSKYQKVGNPMEVVVGLWNHGPEIGKAMREKGLAWPRITKGELADLIEFIRAPKKK